MSGPALRIVGTEPSLEELAAIANREHRGVLKAAQVVLEHARRAGEALIEVRDRCDHGGFLPWLAANCEFSRSSAYSYISIAANWSDPKVPAAGSLAAALVEIAISKGIKPSRHALDDDAMKADPRQILLWPESELPLAPRDPAHEREVMQRADGNDFRCPCCAAEWNGDPRPPLRAKLAQRSPGWTTAKIQKLTQIEQIERKNQVRRKPVAGEDRLAARASALATAERKEVST